MTDASIKTTPDYARSLEQLKEYAIYMMGNNRRLRDALKALMDSHEALVSCGDCGSWDVWTEPEMVAARAALEECTS